MNRSITIADNYNIDTSIAGNGLSGGNGTALSVNVDNSTIEISSDTLRVKDVGITTAKLDNSSVTSFKIAELNVTTSKLADSAVTTIKIADSNVTTAKIADSNVTTAKIANSNVTRAKLESVGQQVSAAIAYSITATSLTDVTNSSVTITTTGRPVILILQPSSDVSRLDITASDITTIALYRDTSQLHGMQYLANSSGSAKVNPCFTFLNVVGAGTYTYKLKAKVSAGTSVLQDYNLIAYEL